MANRPMNKHQPPYCCSLRLTGRLICTGSAGQARDLESSTADGGVSHVPCSREPLKGAPGFEPLSSLPPSSCRHLVSARSPNLKRIEGHCAVLARHQPSATASSRERGAELDLRLSSQMGRERRESTPSFPIPMAAGPVPYCTHFTCRLTPLGRSIVAGQAEDGSFAVIVNQFLHLVTRWLSQRFLYFPSRALTRPECLPKLR